MSNEPLVDPIEGLARELVESQLSLDYQLRRHKRPQAEWAAIVKERGIVRYTPTIGWRLHEIKMNGIVKPVNMAAKVQDMEHEQSTDLG